jgi:hypothetical protein
MDSGLVAVETSILITPIAGLAKVAGLVPISVVFMWAICRCSNAQETDSPAGTTVAV